MKTEKHDGRIEDGIHGLMVESTMLDIGQSWYGVEK